MADGRANNGGKRNGAGSKGYGKLEFVKNKVEQYSELWWKEWEAMMTSNPEDFINDNVKELIKALIDKGEEYTAKDIIKDLAKGALYRKQFAMTEFNKIQIKMIPQTLAGDKDNPIEVNLKIKGKDKEKIDKAISNL